MIDHKDRAKTIGQRRWHEPATLEWIRAKSEQVGECLLWRGAINSSGYANMIHKGKTEAVSRVAYELATGTHPGKLHVLHRCDNRKCVLPAHLFLGTNADNVRDRVAKRRSADMRGEKNANAKLTPEDVSAIRAAMEQRTATSPQLAALFGVNRNLPLRIHKRQLWRSV